ncbi:hypothetical protein ACPUER_09190 [Burkholderia sp. DN3021]|uniref:hypothetical protein n=1 Tax=Burkholderia sp. DN3021 TaxID=3410137 RepID=UPI002857008C|nr:hypothetical protein [Burkholderia ambifaria]MDR6499708.1 hypothetical protein [Burkholderia ambifaria]
MYPDFTNIAVQDFHDVGSAKFGGGKVTLSGSVVTSNANDVTVTGTPGTSTRHDCSAAFTALKSVAPTSSM